MSKLAGVAICGFMQAAAKRRESHRRWLVR